MSAIVPERSDGARGALRESGHGFGTVRAVAEGALLSISLAGGGVPFSVVFGAVPSDGPEKLCDMSLKAFTESRHVARGLDRRGPV
jgi:hypothetical protein